MLLRVALRPLPSWLIPVGVGVAAFLLFLPSFDAWFAVLDFNHLDAIRRTEASTFFLRIFDPSDGGRDIIGTGDLYRPVYYSVFWLQYQAFGTEATAYYVFNALLHATNALLVFALALRLTKSHLASAAGALVWAFHPQYADTVAWVSSTTDLLLVFFSLTAILLYAAALESSDGRRVVAFAGAFAAALLALGAKESGIAIVPIIAGYHLLLGEPDAVGRRRIPWVLLPYLAIPAVYLPVRWLLVGNLMTDGPNEMFTADVFARIHTLAGLAAGPAAGQSVSNSGFGVAQGAAGIALIAASVAAAVLGGRRGWFLVGWFYVALVPVLVLPDPWLVGRYLYLPMVGFAIVAGIGVEHVRRTATSFVSAAWLPPLASIAAVAGILVWFGVLNVDYQNWLTGKGEESERFIAALQTTYPVLPERGRLIVTEQPRSLSLTPGDGMMLGAAVRVAYDADVDVVTPWQFSRGHAPSPTVDDLWYPPREAGSTSLPP